MVFLFAVMSGRHELARALLGLFGAVAEDDVEHSLDVAQQPHNSPSRPLALRVSRDVVVLRAERFLEPVQDAESRADDLGDYLLVSVLSAPQRAATGLHDDPVTGMAELVKVNAFVVATEYHAAGAVHRPLVEAVGAV